MKNLNSIRIVATFCLVSVLNLTPECLAATLDTNYKSTKFCETVFTKPLLQTQKDEVGVDFLTKFWSPKSPIRYVEVVGRDIIVYVPKISAQVSIEALPNTYNGHKILVRLIANDPGTASIRLIETRIVQEKVSVDPTYKQSLYEKHGSEKFSSPPVVLVTGTSAGIGLEIAKLLVNTNFRIVLTSRANSLSVLSQNGIYESDRILIKPLDVTIPEERSKLIKDVTEQWGGIDILVNNAGIAYRSAVEHASTAETDHQMQVNFIGPIELARLVIPLMRFKGRGKIINISSMSGIMGMPTMGIYSASKFALEGTMEALFYEMKPFGINVTLIQPGFVNSDSYTRVQYSNRAKESESDPTDIYNKYYVNMNGFIKKLMGYSLSDSTDIAKIVMKTIEKKNPPLRISGTFDATLLKAFRRFIPQKLYQLLTYYALPNVRKWGKPELESENKEEE